MSETTTTTTTPHIVVIHGSWHTPGHYSKFTTALEHAGYTVHCPALPSCTSPTTSTWADDVKTIHDLVSSLADQGTAVVMVMHSSGGSSGSEAVRGLSVSERQQSQSQNKSGGAAAGGVVHLMYMCGFMLQVGESVGSASTPRPIPEPIQIFDDGMTFPCADLKTLFYHDVSDNEVEKAKKSLIKHRGEVTMTPVTYPAWKYVPTVYIECTEDQIVFPHWQRRQIDAVRATGTEIQVWSYRSSHSPFLSMTGQMVDAVDKVVAQHV